MVKNEKYRQDNLMFAVHAVRATHSCVCGPWMPGLNNKPGHNERGCIRDRFIAWRVVILAEADFVPAAPSRRKPASFGYSRNLSHKPLACAGVMKTTERRERGARAGERGLNGGFRRFSRGLIHCFSVPGAIVRCNQLGDRCHERSAVLLQIPCFPPFRRCRVGAGGGGVPEPTFFRAGGGILARGVPGAGATDEHPAQPAHPHQRRGPRRHGGHASTPWRMRVARPAHDAPRRTAPRWHGDIPHPHAAGAGGRAVEQPEWPDFLATRGGQHASRAAGGAHLAPQRQRKRLLLLRREAYWPRPL